jgi:hypothetical protein
MIQMLSFEETAALLKVVGMAQASEEVLDIPELANDLGRAEDVVISQIEQLEAGAWSLSALNWKRLFSSRPGSNTCVLGEP